MREHENHALQYEIRSQALDKGKSDEKVMNAKRKNPTVWFGMLPAYVRPPTRIRMIWALFLSLQYFIE
jgi:hypothetical protein